MKKTITFLFSILLVMAFAPAQAQFEVTFATGYHGGAFQATNSNAKKVTDFNLSKPNNPDAENIYYSMGAGIPLELGVNIPIMEGLYFNIDLGYWIGSEVTITDADFTIDLPNAQTETKQTVTAKSSQFRINPGLLFRTESGLYAKTNLVIPVSGGTTGATAMETTTTDIQGNTINSAFQNTEFESAGKFSLGVSAGIGYSVNLADNMRLGFELQGLALNIQSASWKMTSYEDDNQVTLDQLPVISKETNYVDALDSESNNLDHNAQADITMPKEDFAQRQSFGAVGVNVRFVYVLGE